MTSLSTHIAPFLLLLHYIEMMLGSNKANKAKYESISMLNLIHETWDEDMYCVMELFLCEKNHLILCTACIDDNVGHHMVVTWYLMEGGHRTK